MTNLKYFSNNQQVHCCINNHATDSGIRLHGLTNKVSNDIATFLCDKLNETKTLYPGTHLHMEFKLVSN